MDTVKIGREAEEAAAEYLAQLGYTIVERNYTFKKVGELDIIALDNNLMVFNRSALPYKQCIRHSRGITYVYEDP